MANARARQLVSAGIELQRRQRTAEAEACYRQALGLDPECFDALQLLGVIRFRAGDLLTGITLLERESNTSDKFSMLRQLCPSFIDQSSLQFVSNVTDS